MGKGIHPFFGGEETLKVKIVLLGDRYGGKSALLHRFRTGSMIDVNRPTAPSEVLPRY